MLHKSSKRRLLASAFILLFSLFLLGLLKNKTSNELVTSVDLKTTSSDPNQKTSYNAEIYVPSITITKGTNFNSSDCSGFSIDYTVENTSDAAEVFTNVQVTDADIGGLSPIFVSGDDNNNSRLDPGEKWNYTTNYGITQDDINNDSIVTQLATVVADVQGQGIQVTNDTSSDAPTIIDLTPCQIASMGLIKTSAPIDLDMDGNNCAENLLYTFQVLNTGNLDLLNLELDDPLLGGLVPGPVPSSDVGNDGVLSPNETWEYQALYSADLLASGTIRNQAEINAETVLGLPVSDLSDDDSYLENEETPSPYDEVCTGAFARIGLIKTGLPRDSDGDNCDDTIQYTFTVRNVREAPLEEVVLTDPLLGGEITNRTDNGDGDDILAPGETWLYQGEYMVTPEDIVNGSVPNRALVQAKLVGFDIFLFDYSDNNSFDENDETLEQMDDYCSTQRIGLLKRAGASDFLVDRDGDGCLESLHYEFTVTNTGGVDLDEVVLNDPLLDGDIDGPISGDNGDGKLAVGETWIYEAYYPLLQADLDRGFVDNLATVRAQEVGTEDEHSDLSDHSSFDEDRPTRASTLAGSICPTEANIGLLKPIGTLVDLTNDGCPETIRYQFEVENTGTIDLQQVTITDVNLHNPISGPIFDDGNDNILSVGEKWLFEASYAITEQDIQDGAVFNQAEVTAVDRFFGNPVSDFSDPDNANQDRETETLVPGGVCSSSRIGLIKSFSAPLEDINGDSCPEIINYVLTVRNVGNIPLDQVVVDDPQLSNLLVGPQNDAGNDEVLSPGEEWIYEAPYPITSQDINAGSITNNASVTAFEEGTNNEVTDLSHDLSFDEDGDTTVLIGCGDAVASVALVKVANGILDNDNNGCPETIEYEFIVRNTGEINLDQISIVDLDFTVQITGPNTDKGDGILSPNEEWRYLGYYFLTEQDINAMSVTNRAEVTGQDTFSNNTVTDLSDNSDFTLNRQTVTSTVGACFSESSIGLIKVASSSFEDLDNDGCPENIPYIFTIRNTGSIPLEQVVLSDALLGPNPINGPLTDINDDGILSPTETWTYRALYPITEDDIEATVVSNQANVLAFEQGTVNAVSDDSDDNSFDENDETITSVVGACPAEARITLTKNAILIDSDADGCPETIRYSFIVDNTGVIDLHQIIITDPLLPNPIDSPLMDSDINNDGILSISETWTYIAEYTITQTDYDEGFVTNQAQVSTLEVITNNSIEASSEEITTSFADVCEDSTGPVNSNFEIFNGITPNGDGINDFFEIREIENYPNNSLQIFNRWGVLVYEAQSYGIDNVLFSGQSEGRATIAEERALPTGTYFYTLTFTGDNPGQEVYSGYLYLSQD